MQGGPVKCTTVVQLCRNEPAAGNGGGLGTGFAAIAYRHTMLPNKVLRS
jgi:hypothetical protein